MDSYAKLAKDTIEEHIKIKKTIAAPFDLPPELYSRRAGVFVTIHKGEELRGCVGTHLPTKKNIAEEIISNAVSACSRDYRFAPITVEELPNLSYEVSVLSEPILLKNLEKHNPKKDGIIVRCADGRCGLLLPDLEGVDTAEEQIAIACRKGGIDPRADNVKLYYFTAEKHK